MSVALWPRCGHPRTAENTTRGTRSGCCRQCNNARRRAQYDADMQRMEYRVRYLPGAIERARNKLRRLENEAREYRMWDLLTDPCHVNDAWNRAIDEAKANIA